jgi:hypothetical protein
MLFKLGLDQIALWALAALEPVWCHAHVASLFLGTVEQLPTRGTPQIQVYLLLVDEPVVGAGRNVLAEGALEKLFQRVLGPEVGPQAGLAPERVLTLGTLVGGCSGLAASATGTSWWLKQLVVWRS